MPHLAEIVTKANTIQKSGSAIETTAKEIKDDIERRVAEVLALLRLDAERKPLLLICVYLHPSAVAFPEAVRRAEAPR